MGYGIYSNKRRLMVSALTLVTIGKKSFANALAIQSESQLIRAPDFEIFPNTRDDSSPNIQRALDYIGTSGGGRLRLDMGDYIVGRQLRIRKNTIFDLNGSRLIRSFNNSITGAGLLGVGPKANNVSIINGIVDGNGKNFPQSFDLLWAKSVSSLFLSNLVFKDVVDFHAVDLANVNGVNVVGCSFLGFSLSSGSNRKFSEAIQLDPSIKEGGLANQGVTIDGCRFDRSDTLGFGNWPVGVGNHAYAPNSSDSDIAIINCNFNGNSYAGIRIYSWEKCRIENNSFDGIGGYAVLCSASPKVARGGRDIRIIDNKFLSAGESFIRFPSNFPGCENYDSAYVNIVVKENDFLLRTGMVGIDVDSVRGLEVSQNKIKGSGVFVNLGCSKDFYFGENVFVGSGIKRISNKVVR